MTSFASGTAPPRDVPAPGLGLDGRRRAVAIFVVLSAMTLAVLDAGMANVALPSIGHALDIEPATSILIVTAYQAGLVMALLPLGAVGERFGHRRVFTGSVALFALASGFSAVCPSLLWLAFARFLQGIGGAGIMALGVALLRFTVPGNRLGAAIGWNALAVALASAAGPSVGALILSMTSWPWLFAMNLPIAILTLLGSRALPHSPRGAQALDVPSMGLMASTFAMLIIAAQCATTAPKMTSGLTAASVVAFMLLLRREAPKMQPLFPLDLLRRAPFRLSVTASICCFAAQASGLLGLSFLLQHELHLTPLMTGLYITVWPLSVAGAAIV
ncbi:MAG: MFS transporter, partial [Phenylobacterium sp.]|uniref:MFS transporter n=1 Tax=Phenylobacterium sp. TaxID=1871053 RepID=UPI001A23B6AC